ncbi:hypothetical protein QJS66_11365 [Kocuria rhizophila]|nr:hypothetical protein QJS66_11365 [Kocuria rhizophila]
MTRRGALRPAVPRLRRRLRRPWCGPSRHGRTAGRTGPPTPAGLATIPRRVDLRGHHAGSRPPALPGPDSDPTRASRVPHGRHRQGAPADHGARLIWSVPPSPRVPADLRAVARGHVRAGSSALLGHVHGTRAGWACWT